MAESTDLKENLENVSDIESFDIEDFDMSGISFSPPDGAFEDLEEFNNIPDFSSVSLDDSLQNTLDEMKEENNFSEETIYDNDVNISEFNTPDFSNVSENTKEEIGDNMDFSPPQFDINSFNNENTENLQEEITETEKVKVNVDNEIQLESPVKSVEVPVFSNVSTNTSSKDRDALMKTALKNLINFIQKENVSAINNEKSR